MRARAKECRQGDTMNLINVDWKKCLSDDNLTSDWFAHLGIDNIFTKVVKFSIVKHDVCVCVCD